MLCIELLLAALTLVTPDDGATVPVLSQVQKDYLALSMDERFQRVDSVSNRVELLSGGQFQPPLRLSWNGAAGEIYRLEIGLADGGETETFFVTNRTEAFLTNLEIGRKYRWSVSAGGESASRTFLTEDTPPRLIRVEGVKNFRDLGGWKGLGGRRVRQNMIFRSAGLRASAQSKGGSFVNKKSVPGARRVTDGGLEVLRGFGIRTNLELRRPSETTFMTSSVLGDDVVWMCEQLVAYDFIDNHERGRMQFAKIFRAFLDRANYPFLFHCSGGRDRTGTLAFLLGALLGMSEDDLCKDWEVTVFAENSVAFGSSRIVSLVSYLKRLGGDVRVGAEKYAALCGITHEEIEKFRGLMLEDPR